MANSLTDIRKEYIREILSEEMVKADPFGQFDSWWHEALQSGIEEVNAMTLATANANGRPSARTVLLKGFDERGFVFFTNYQSQKGRDMAANPFVSLLFFWKELERQVRIEGRVVKVDASESDLYFQSRPAGSQIGAWASPQSQVIRSRKILEEKVKEIENRFSTEKISRPDFWGGYLVIPDQFEFWQGRPNRLHDRIHYTLQGDKQWKIERLAP